MNIWQTDTVTLIVGVSLIIAFHVAWVASSIKYNTLVLPALGFLMASPLSLAPAFPHFELFKLGRIYCTVLILGFGFVYFYRHQRFGVASAAFLLFALYFFGGAFYSSEPRDALQYKGAFLLAAVGGLFFGLRVASAADLTTLTRQLILYATIFDAFILSGIILSPSAGWRLSTWQMNANGIAGTAALLMIALAYVGLQDPSRKLRLIAYVLFFVNLVMLLSTGSRGGLAKAVVGVLIVIAPLLKSPKTVFSIALLTTLGLYITLGYFLPEASGRMLSTENSREQVWTASWSLIQESPFVGLGWAHSFINGSFRPVNAHSVPLQLLLDIGMLGLAASIVLFALVFRVCLSTLAFFGRSGLGKMPLCLAFALFGAVMIQGLAEAGALFGSTIDPFYWGMGIGLVDALRRIAKAEQAELAGYAQDAQWEPSRYHLAQ